MKTLYLHIGSPKTGTTSIQNVFTRNRAALAEMGVFYPPTFAARQAHHDLAWAMRNKFGLARQSGIQPGASLDEIAEELVSAVCQSPAPAAVVSSEAFFHLGRQSRKALQLLRRVFSPFEVRIVVYLRRQDLFFESNYAQNVKAGAYHRDPPETRFLATLEQQWLCYDRLLRPWEQAFGRENIVLRVFERAQLQGGDAVTDFLHVLGLGPEAQAGLARGTDANVTPTAETIVLLSRLNRIELPRAARASIYQQILASPGIRDSSSTSRLISPSLRQRAFERYRPSNEWVRKRYRTDLAELFHSPQGDARTALAYAAEDVDRLAEILPDELLAELLRAALKTPAEG